MKKINPQELRESFNKLVEFLMREVKMRVWMIFALVISGFLLRGLILK